MSLSFDSFVAGVQEKFPPFVFELTDGPEVEFRRAQMLSKRERDKVQELFTVFTTDAMKLEGAQGLTQGIMKDAESLEDLEKAQKIMEEVDLPDVAAFYRSLLHVFATDKAAFKELEKAMRTLPGDPEVYWTELFDAYTESVGDTGSDLGE